MIRKIIYKIIITLLIPLLLNADYNNISLSNFANIVAAQNHINIVIDDNLDKQFTFIITKPIKSYTNLDVFIELLNKNGFELLYRKNYYIVIKKSDKRVSKMSIFKLKYINAKKVVPEIEKTLNSFYKIQQKENINPKNTPPVKAYKQDSNATIKQYKDYSVVAITPKTIALTYKDDFIKKYTRQIIAAIDNKKKQITILAKIFEVNTNKLKELGINMQAFGDMRSKHFNTNITIANSLPVITYSNTLQINTILKLLNDKKNSKLISNPKLQLLLGSKAIFKDGATYPITTETTTVANSSTTTQSKKTTYIDIGLLFSIYYQDTYNDQNYISINLQKKDLLNYNPNEQNIITTTRQISTTIRINDNTNIVIAGLGKSSETKKIFKVPLLSKIPLIGKLFQYKYTNNTNTTLVITLECVIPKTNIMPPMRRLYVK